MRRSADGRGDLNGAVGSPCSFKLNGALWVSLMMRILVLTVKFDMIVGVGRRKRGLFNESDVCSRGVVESLTGGLWTISLHHLAKLLKCRVAICMETWTQAEDVGLTFVPCLIRHA
jgi:hypothetical protein